MSAGRGARSRARASRPQYRTHPGGFSLQCRHARRRAFWRELPVHTPLLAYHDPQFIDSDDGRPIRIVSEYLAPLRAFRDEEVNATVVFFGSARIGPRSPLGRYYEEASELARLVTAWSQRECSGRLIVCSGGGPGIMEAANRGASLAGGRSLGLNIGLPHEQRPNRFISEGLCFEFHYFFMRKLWFAHLAHALIAFPGGFGTFDELFEILTLAQTRKLDRPIPVFLYGSTYWNEVVNFEALVRHGTIDAEDLKLFEFVDEPHAALARLQARMPAPPAGPCVAFAKSRCHPGA
ncbi:MAG: TIGR00730 family Rossman fold protein [Gammaproteobacteria bacterium]|nr:TIGR00730 family Rossman fold protein [Gammaproteobacteria bacterium]